ncbi:J domain-containing protein required for chloroplast accumulation response 1 isoform X2 [Cicer arietinum]|uniref:J domain-containing protein required for chloroplast accumulation response 1 isoform X2 n=1 Tax=Cicer arietinum TaxID=3827 RepID=A0A1S2Y8A9_CICAR|nr:J domain-containing protein required for chloroplast accumulation response 1 isoform X2 [Cicer arietinum]
MERFLKFSEQGDEGNENPSTARRNAEVDFNDVFGGPPRRSSVNETVRGEEGEGSWCRWPNYESESESEREKPVFGEDSGNRRRYQNKKAKEFFDDIFGGEESRSESVCSTPNKRLDAAAFTPALQPLASSLPPSFSLPAKSTKGADLQTFGSPPSSRKPLDIDIAASNRSDFSDSHLSRFSVQHKELQNDLKPSHRPSLLSKEFSNLSQADEVDKGNNMKQDTSDDKFHFSIYKWASKGVPLAMPLRTERTSRTKDKFKLKKCSSANEWIVTEITTQNDSPITYNGSPLRNKKQDVSTTSTSTHNKVDAHQTGEHIVSAKAQSDSLSSRQIFIKDVLSSPISYVARAESSSRSTSEIVFYEKPEAASETHKHESKSLHSLFSKSNEKQDFDETTRKEREENMTKGSKKLSPIFDIPVNPKKQDEKRKTVSLRENSKGSLSPGKNMGKGQVKGKVKEFVHIFNQEAVTKPRVNSKSQLQGYTYKQKRDAKANNNVDGNSEQSKKEIYTVETVDMSANNLSQQEDISASEIHDISFAVNGDKDESFHDNFTIEVLAQDEGEDSQNQEIQVIDKKIQLWSKGKEGNIRSLLSTLQYVLWPNCGWKPVPLVDIIDGNAVKRSYQRALLCLHPDKLQQKGAASDQKYIAEKVFDILQEAWTQFNMVGAL